MMHVELLDAEKELIGFVQIWLDLLANGKDEEACSLLDKPNCYGIEWTPEKIREILEEEFSAESIFGRAHPEGVSFSTVKETFGECKADVLRFDDGSGYSVEHDVPLNGEWSDLTARFEFIGKAPRFEVILHDLHVL